LCSFTNFYTLDSTGDTRIDAFVIVTGGRRESWCVRLENGRSTPLESGCRKQQQRRPTSSTRPSGLTHRNYRLAGLGGASCSSRLLRRCHAALFSFCAHCLHRGLMASGCAPAAGGTTCFCRKSFLRCGGMSFFLECCQGRGRTFSRRLRAVLSTSALSNSLLSGLLRGCPFSRRLKLDTRTSGFGKSDGDGLLGRFHSVLSFANVVNLFADKFARLRAR